MSNLDSVHGTDANYQIIVDGKPALPTLDSAWKSVASYHYSRPLALVALVVIIGAGIFLVNTAATSKSLRPNTAVTASSLWPTTSVPQTLSDDDTKSAELGVKFRAQSSGNITGVRFYKSRQNSGMHTGSLWDNSGTLLSTATFTNETAGGWQAVSFTSPVKITADVIYVVSYHAPNGHYSSSSNYFATKAYTRGPLTALKDSSGSPNGVYTHSGGSSFPKLGHQSNNYWVDVLFRASPSSPATAPALTTVPSTVLAPPSTVSATPSGNSIVVSWTAGVSGTPLTSYNLYRNGVLLKSVGKVLTYTDSLVTNGTSYSYQVASVAASTTSVLSNSAVVKLTNPIVGVVAPRTAQISGSTAGPSPAQGPGSITSPGPVAGSGSNPTPTPGPSPVSYGWQRNTSNTGLAGVGIDRNTLPTYSGNVTPGMTLSQVKITSSLDLTNVPNVTLDRVWLKPTDGPYALKIGSGTVVKNSDIDGSAMPTSGERIIYGFVQSGTYTLTNVSITNMTVGAWFDGPASGTMNDTYIGSMFSGNGAHKDGFTRRDGVGLLAITRCHIDDTSNATTGAFFLQNTWGGQIGGITVKDSLLEGDGYVLTLENKGAGTSVGFNNVRINSTGYGPIASTPNSGNGPGSISYTDWTNVYVYNPNSLPNAIGAVINHN